MIRWLCILPLYLWITISCNKHTLYTYGPSSIRPDSESVAVNILGKQNKNPNLSNGFNIWHILYRLFQKIFKGLAGDTGLRNSGSFLQRRLPPNIPFPCKRFNQRSGAVPDNVHQLRPGDIDVVAAIGDSLTAATGANAIALFEASVDNRGLSFSIGGQGNYRTHLTLPNILKEFNPRLIGFSWRDASSVDPGAVFNLAEDVALTSDMPFMAYKLLRRMRLDRRVNMERHWKLVTITVGVNDFCLDVCQQNISPRRISRRQEDNLIKTLRIIRDTMPRTFVNLVAEPLTSLIISMDVILSLPFPCRIGRSVLCSCLEGIRHSQARDLYLALLQNYKQILQRVAHRAEFQRDDFTVVFQPFGLNASVFIDDQTPEISIMAYDCINLSQKGHAVLANGLFNNMMQPSGLKTIGLRPLYKEFVCPTEENPYLRTYFNSFQAVDSIF
ncbi:phospholipase B1, membrane-associated-like [Sitodiplosis mosellana]|uniref:phospholipase B1, membrane-associated-like n=1 Tax=Sitodiplosis mosellana TaxID=263140 RepID=UPI0024451576|nr:phospholipase B1, membrane-associated-like [Sitodiplosis mosellana]